MVVVADDDYSALELIAAVRRSPLLHHQAAPRRQFVRASTETPERPNGAACTERRNAAQLNAVLTNQKTTWTSVTLTNWSADRTRELEYVSGTAVKYFDGHAPGCAPLGSGCVIRPASATTHELGEPSDCTSCVAAWLVRAAENQGAGAPPRPAAENQTSPVMTVVQQPADNRQQERITMDGLPAPSARAAHQSEADRPALAMPNQGTGCELRRRWWQRACAEQTEGSQGDQDECPP